MDAEGGVLLVALEQTGDLPHRGGGRGVHEAGGDGVHPDVAVAELECGHPHQSDHAGLGRAVGGLAPCRLDGGQAGHRDDRATVGHHPPGRLHGQEGAGQVEVDDAPELGDRVVEDRRRGAPTRVGDGDVEVPEAFHGRARERRRPVVGGDVAGHDHDRVAEGGGEIVEKGLVEVADADLGPLGHEPLHDGAPDAARATGDDRDLPRQASGHVGRWAFQLSPCSSAAVPMRRRRSTCPPGMSMPNEVQVRNSRTTTPSGPAS